MEGVFGALQRSQGAPEEEQPEGLPRDSPVTLCPVCRRLGLRPDSGEEFPGFSARAEQVWRDPGADYGGTEEGREWPSAGEAFLER